MIEFFTKHELVINVICFPLGIFALSITTKRNFIPSIVFLISWSLIALNLFINVLEKGF